MILKIILYLFFSVGGLVLIKIGGKGTDFIITGNLINLKVTIPIIIGLSFYVVSFLLWIVILKSNELSYIVTLINGLSYICILISSVLFLNEKITLYKGIGIVIIFIGIMVLNYKK